MVTRWSKAYALAIIFNVLASAYSDNQTTIKNPSTIKVSVLRQDPQPAKTTIEKKDTSRRATEIDANVTVDNGKADTKIKIDEIPEVEETEEAKGLISKDKSIFEVLAASIRRIIAAILNADKVVGVLRNVAICIINGAMDLAAFYFPAPLLPMFATMVSYLVPIEPVVTLRRKLPVSSYKKAINTAVNGFLKTFDRYKLALEDDDDDPYMTRFNRRFNIDSSENSAKPFTTKKKS